MIEKILMTVANIEEGKNHHNSISYSRSSSKICLICNNIYGSNNTGSIKIRYSSIR